MNNSKFKLCHPEVIEKLNIIDDVSNKLADDIYLVVCRSYGYVSGWASGPEATCKYLDVLSKNIALLIDVLDDKSNPLLYYGIDVICINYDYWFIIERATEEICINDNGRQNVSLLTKAFQYFIKSYFNDKNILSPSYILSQSGKAYTIAPLYKVSIGFLKECKLLLLEYAKKQVCPEKSMKKINDTINGIMDASEVDDIIEGFRDDGFSYISRNSDNCIRALNSCRINRHKYGLVVLIRDVNNFMLGPNRKSIPMGKIEIEYDGIYGNIFSASLVSKEIVIQAKDYIEKAKDSCVTHNVGKSPKEFVSTMPGLGRLLYEYQYTLDSEEIELLSKKGILAFSDNNGKLLRWFYELYQKFESPPCNILKKTGVLPTITKSGFKKSYSCLIGLLSYLKGYKVDVRNFYPYYLEFPHEGDPLSTRFCSIKDIYINYYKLGNELIILKEKMTASTSYDSLNNSSIFNYFRVFKSVFVTCLEKLDNEDKELLSEYGCKAFTLNNHFILKKCLEYIQSRFLSNEIMGDSAHAQQKVLKTLLKMSNLTWIDAYPINIGRAKNIIKQRAIDNIYTTEEIVHLAYHIELLLSKSNLLKIHQLWLRVARILIKTNWNLSPLCNLETSDLYQVEFSGKKTYLVRLLKARAGYVTQWNRFSITSDSLLEEDIKFGKDVQSVIRDLEFIKDDLTQDIRNNLQDDHPFKYSLMLYTDGMHNNGRVKKLTNSFTNGLNDMLKNNGCQVVFTPSKIRKGGLNFIYRSVSKDFCKYKVVGKHSWSVFRAKYFNYSNEDSKNILNNAVSIMGDYFNGREISDDIIIVTEMKSDWQHVPSGRCASSGADSLAELYNSVHYSLFKKIGIDKNQHCADFNACLWCEYYRCIADAEHVYRLVSYRDFIVADIEGSIIGVINSGKQEDYLKLLTQRIENILVDMDNINPGCRKEGETFLAEHGIHPDWDFISTTSLLE